MPPYRVIVIDEETGAQVNLGRDASNFVANQWGSQISNRLTQQQQQYYQTSQSGSVEGQQGQPVVQVQSSSSSQPYYEWVPSSRGLVPMRMGEYQREQPIRYDQFANSRGEVVWMPVYADSSRPGSGAPVRLGISPDGQVYGSNTNVNTNISTQVDTPSTPSTPSTNRRTESMTFEDGTRIQNVNGRWTNMIDDNTFAEEIVNSAMGVPNVTIPLQPSPSPSQVTIPFQSSPAPPQISGVNNISDIDREILNRNRQVLTEGRIPMYPNIAIYGYSNYPGSYEEFRNAWWGEDADAVKEKYYNLAVQNGLFDPQVSWEDVLGRFGRTSTPTENTSAENDDSLLIQQVANRFTPTPEDFNRVGGRWGLIDNYDEFLQGWETMNAADKELFWNTVRGNQ